MASIRVKKDTTDDYLVAGRGMHPALAALSAVSTWNSGYMFIGFVGFLWMFGYSAIWIAIISTIGQLVAWIWFYKRIQHESKKRNVRSLSSLVAKVNGAPEAKLAAICSVLFLLIYAAAQLSSGGKALFAMLGWSEVTGILIGYILVILYCTAGGIRASIWTDAIQSCVMIIGSSLLCFVALSDVGWIGGLHSSLTSIDPQLTSLMPSEMKFGITLWLFAFFLGGIGVAGQPQVVTRVMTLESDKDRIQACIWFFVWQTPFLILMVLIGLASRVMFPVENFDPEMALPKMAMEVLDPFWVGLILASIFAATMSTADSQVLACTAAITDDIVPDWAQDHKKTKLTTITMAIIATAISLFAYFTENNSVFDLVVLSVYGLGSMFIPLLIIRFTGFQPSSQHSIAMMLAALFTVVIWSSATGLATDLFPSVPGMGAAFLVHLFYCIRDKEPWLMDRIPSREKAITWGIVSVGAIVTLEVLIIILA